MAIFSNPRFWIKVKDYKKQKIKLKFRNKLCVKIDETINHISKFTKRVQIDCSVSCF